jgi:hypothetical protein
MNGLQAGESRDVSFTFNADNYQDGQRVNFVGALNLVSGRRIGILNESREIPSLQDYAFKIKGGNDISDLRKKGKERMKVFVKNISARQATQTLTLTLSIIGPNSSSFSFVKGNQETFDPIAPGGESSGEKIVIKTSKSNSGGTIVMEVREGGKLLGVLKQNF